MIKLLLKEDNSMKKISYLTLQKKYPRKVVVLDKNERRVLAVGEKAKELLKQLKEKKVKLRDIVFVGPISKSGTINVYFSVRK
ncbi:hypothetical protein A3D77_00350 [Candidatus Gottesmanbacteria bacterium RIFCSPHIGHO2_02_FULL_39_11]|uniref:DUF5678 domain-containing protein n=1 Tax=Candidatus Gottesmanbacteria bacterium RIFCSPHIGHO2_02_FULL_39_11 TaxID=1798382 RepID=A0A1F5ZLA7_9BACT|nr:MAG: hypothetical protein A3D77_00350 [Candidatus Gottesmanbacteria bacterium RIFCSPHIGHO2_02_FULL_39_11]